MKSCLLYRWDFTHRVTHKSHHVQMQCWTTSSAWKWAEGFQNRNTDDVTVVAGLSIGTSSESTPPGVWVPQQRRCWCRQGSRCWGRLLCTLEGTLEHSLAFPSKYLSWQAWLDLCGQAPRCISLFSVFLLQRSLQPYFTFAFFESRNN